MNEDACDKIKKLFANIKVSGKDIYELKQKLKDRIEKEALEK